MDSLLKQIAAAHDSGVSTRVMIFTAIVVAIPLLIFITYVRIDYLRHKRPLQEIDPNVRYTMWHHIKIVTLPLFSYRITFMLQKKQK